MRVALVSVQVPFVRGGAEFLADACKEAMINRKIDAEIITLPYKWYPPETILDHIKIARLLDLSESNGQKIDKVICLKFPAYICQHENKTLWLLHQHRQAYDLYDTPFGDLNLNKTGKKVAKKIKKIDCKFIPEHRHIYTISKNIAKKLLTFNNINTDEVLYPPPHNQELFTSGSYDNYILYPSRFNEIKRQELIVKAMQWTPSRLKLILLGNYHNEYGYKIKELVEQLDLNDKIIFKDFVTEQEKIALYSNCLAVYNGVFDEDYGYVTIEAFLSSKPVIAHTDSGGPNEFICHGENGFIVPPCPREIANSLRIFHENNSIAMKYGQNGKLSLQQKNISWDYIIEKLIS